MVGSGILHRALERKRALSSGFLLVLLGSGSLFSETFTSYSIIYINIDKITYTNIDNLTSLDISCCIHTGPI